MLTTLSIISLDQGKIWTDPCRCHERMQLPAQRKRPNA